MRQVVIVSGRTCTGKSKLSERLKDGFDFIVLRTGDLLKEIAQQRGLPTDRLSLQDLGDELDSETRHRWIFERIIERLKDFPENQPIVIDNIRNKAQLALFRSKHEWNVVHAHLYASTEILERRFAEKRANRPDETANTFSEADLIKKEEDIDTFIKDADVRINTSRANSGDILVRVGARLGLFPPPDIRCVDVIVGGQYGSEGKGHIAAYLSREYDLLIRVGGPNAGHTVSSESGIYTYHHLPSGCRDTNAEILLGPGMTINVEKLLKEIKDCNIDSKRLFIDPQAMIIEDVDVSTETAMVGSIGSTGSGSGAATARRILGRGAGKVHLAKDIPELEPYVGIGPKYRGSTLDRLEGAYRTGKAILLEGTQGSGLSLYHGTYPFVTSRDTNVAGCLAEAGISPTRVRRVIMVIRPTPIRVGNPNSGEGTSGPIKNETDFRTVAKEAGLNPEEITKFEKTSTTKRDRRVGWFDWELFRKSCALNAPTDIALTFADYLISTNSEARRFEQLNQDTIKFVEEIERVAHAPVSLINTRFPRAPGERIDLRTVIDRRNWITSKHKGKL